MDELIKLVAQKAGIPEERAKIAVDTVLKYVKEQLPEPMASQLDGLLAGDIPSELLKGLSGLFGQK